MAQPSPFDTFRSRSLIGGWLLLFFPVLVVTLASFKDPRGQAAEMAAVYLMYGIMALWAVLLMRYHRVSWRSLLGRGDWRTHGRLVLLALPLMAFAFGAIWLIYYPLLSAVLHQPGPGDLAPQHRRGGYSCRPMGP